jgi:mycothiol synthase
MVDMKITLHPFTWADLSTIVDLVNRSEAVDKVERGTSEEELETLWRLPGVEAEANGFLALVGADVVGYGRLHFSEGDERGGFSSFRAYGTVVPEWRRRGIGTRIMIELERRAQARLDEISTSAVYFQAVADQRQVGSAALYRSRGMEPVRYFFIMVYDDPEMPSVPDYPPGYRVRRFVRNQDEETVWRVANTAFRDHWGHVEESLEEWLSWFETDYCSPDLIFIGLDPSGAAVGLSLSAVYPERNERVGREQGWVEALAVLREHRRRGLGRALLLDGMRTLRRRGCTHLMLGVDSQNLTGALALYESVGMHQWSTGVTFRKTLRE